MLLFSRDAKIKERHIRQPVIQASQNCGGDKDDIQKHIHSKYEGVSGGATTGPQY